jgi:hypothetical protein
MRKLKNAQIEEVSGKILRRCCGFCTLEKGIYGLISRDS